MLENDYLMRILLQFGEMLRQSWGVGKNDKDPLRASDLLEEMIGQATGIDADVLLALSPDSIASITRISGVDPRVIEYIAHTLLEIANNYEAAGYAEKAELRREQAHALADSYGFELMGTKDETGKFFFEGRQEYDPLWYEYEDEELEEDEHDDSSKRFQRPKVSGPVGFEWAVPESPQARRASFDGSEDNDSNR